MLTRRATTILLGSASFLALQPGPIRLAQAQAGAAQAGAAQAGAPQAGERAVAFVKTTTDQLVAIANAAGSPAEKRRRLAVVLDAAVDLDDIARFCLGRFWRIATPDQQKQYTALFHDLMVVEIAGHIGDYQGASVTMGLSRTFRDTEIVITTVEQPAAPPRRIDWVIGTATGSPRIVDLVAEGTSMRITQASDFTAFLSHHEYNIQDLIDEMRQKSSQNG